MKMLSELEGFTQQQACWQQCYNLSRWWGCNINLQYPALLYFQQINCTFFPTANWLNATIYSLETKTALFHKSKLSKLTIEGNVSFKDLTFALIRTGKKCASFIKTKKQEKFDTLVTHSLAKYFLRISQLAVKLKCWHFIWCFVFCNICLRPNLGWSLTIIWYARCIMRLSTIEMAMGTLGFK